MFYGGIKFNKNWFGRRRWYARFKIDDEIKWIKVSNKEIDKLLPQNSNRFMASNMKCGAMSYTYPLKVNVNVDGGNININAVDARLECNLPLSLYSSMELKLIANHRRC